MESCFTFKSTIKNLKHHFTHRKRAWIAQENQTTICECCWTITSMKNWGYNAEKLDGGWKPYLYSGIKPEKCACVGMEIFAL